MNLLLPLSVVAGLLLLSLLFKPLANRLRFPFEAVLLLFGFGFSFLISDAEALGLNSAVLRDMVFYVFLPILIFSSAYSMDAPRFARNLLGIILLALPLALISLALTAVMVYYGIGHPQGFPWIAAMLTGAMLLATNSQALQHAFLHLRLPPDLRTLISGEDLLTNAFGIVLFSMLLAFALQPGIPMSPGDMTLHFFLEAIGGILVGLGIGFLALIFLRLRCPAPTEVALLTLVVAFISYLLAEHLLGVSGVLSVLITALIMGRTMHQDLDAPQDHFVDEFWRFNATLAGSMLYLMLGLSISISMFADRWLAMLIGISAVVMARILGLLIIMPPLRRVCKGLKERADRTMLYLSSARGAVAVGLALSVPAELSYWWTIQSIGFGVVLFTVLAQAPLLESWHQKKSSAAKELEVDPDEH